MTATVPHRSGSTQPTGGPRTPRAGLDVRPTAYVNSFIDQIGTAPTLANGLAYVMVSGGLRVARTDCTLVENCSPKKSITLNGPILGSSQQVLVKDGRFSS